MSRNAKHHNRFRRTFSLESLEQRQLMAADSAPVMDMPMMGTAGDDVPAWVGAYMSGKPASENAIAAQIPNMGMNSWNTLSC
jgi:hypothetical protein